MFKKFVSILISGSLVFLCGISAFASGSTFGVSKNLENVVSITAEDSIVSQAKQISKTDRVENGRLITTSIYQLEDGTMVKDVLNRSAYLISSTNGQDTVTRTKYVQNSGYVTLTASFRWYRENGIGKVECTNASGTYSFPSNIEVVECYTSRPTGSSSFPVRATMFYHVYVKNAPMLFSEGSFYIQCDANGNISNNA